MTKKTNVVGHDNMGERVGRVEVDDYTDLPEVYLEAIDESTYNGEPKRAVVILTPTEAREVAQGLLASADRAAAHLSTTD